MFCAQCGKVSRSNISLPVVFRNIVTIPTHIMFIKNPVNTWGGGREGKRERVRERKEGRGKEGGREGGREIQWDGEGRREKMCMCVR